MRATTLTALPGPVEQIALHYDTGDTHAGISTHGIIDGVIIDRFSETVILHLVFALIHLHNIILSLLGRLAI